MNGKEIWFWRAVVLILIVGLAFTAPTVLSTKTDAVCEAVNENRALIRFIVGKKPIETATPIDADPALAEVIRKANVRSEAVFKKVQRVTMAADC